MNPNGMTGGGGPGEGRRALGHCVGQARTWRLTIPISDELRQWGVVGRNSAPQLLPAAAHAEMAIGRSLTGISFAPKKPVYGGARPCRPQHRPPPGLPAFSAACLRRAEARWPSAPTRGCARYMILYALAPTPSARIVFEQERLPHILGAYPMHLRHRCIYT